jgi:hypothetical protein
MRTPSGDPDGSSGHAAAALGTFGKDVRTDLTVLVVVLGALLGARLTQFGTRLRE